MVEIRQLSTTGGLDNILISFRKWAKLNGLTQREVAEALKISQPYVSKILKGKSKDIPFDLVINMLKLMGLDLLTGKVIYNGTKEKEGKD